MLASLLFHFTLQGVDLGPKQLVLLFEGFGLLAPNLCAVLQNGFMLLELPLVDRFCVGDLLLLLSNLGLQPLLEFRRLIQLFFELFCLLCSQGELFLMACANFLQLSGFRFMVLNPGLKGRGLFAHLAQRFISLLDLDL